MQEVEAAGISTKHRTKQSDAAWQAYAAIMRCETRRPDLKENPFWTMLRHDAYERFVIEFESKK